MVATKLITQELAAELVQRILPKVTRVRRRHRMTACWEMQSYRNRATGYTAIAKMVDGKVTYYFAHRVTYTHAHGPIPDGFTVDHLCENPTCCNPDHLTAGPHATNVLRSRRNPFALHAQQTECVRGHALPPRSLTVSQKRRCLECARIGTAERRARKRRAAADKLTRGDA